VFSELHDQSDSLERQDAWLTRCFSAVAETSELVSLNFNGDFLAGLETLVF